MRFNYLFAAIIFTGTIFFLNSCNDEIKKGDVDLVFKVTYGGQPLEMFKNYKYPVTGELLNFTRFAFYVADINVKKQSNSSGQVTEIKTTEIDFLDVTEAHTGNLGVNGFVYTLKGVEEGEYSGLRFGLGVPPALNAKEPKDYPASNVLSSTSNYWSVWKSYIFFRPEGKIDLKNDGTPGEGFALHLGGDSAYVPFDFMKTFIVQEGVNARIEIEIDLEKYFNAKALYPIRSNPSIHSLEQKPQMDILAENLKQSVQVK